MVCFDFPLARLLEYPYIYTIMMSHNWRGEQTIIYKGVKTFL